MPRLLAGNSAILAGIVIAALGIWLSRKIGDPYFDSGASLAIGLVLIGVAVLLARKRDGMPVNGRISRDQIAQVRSIIAADPAVESVGNLQTVQLGLDSVLLTAAVCFERRLNPLEVEQAIDRLDRSIKEQYPAMWQLCLESVPCRAIVRPVRPTEKHATL